MKTTRACMRCGDWHVDAERSAGRRLSCTEVKRFWTRVRNEHCACYGHRPQIVSAPGGGWFCVCCDRPVGGGWPDDW